MIANLIRYNLVVFCLTGTLAASRLFGLKSVENVLTSLEDSLQSLQQKENVKSSLHLIINAFSLLLPHQPSLFPYVPLFPPFC
jgi:hypothetical protein